MEFSAVSNKQDSTPKVVAKAATAGAAIGGAYAAGSKLAPTVKDTFTSSIKNQEAILKDYAEKVVENPKLTVGDYIKSEKELIDGTTSTKIRHRLDSDLGFELNPKKGQFENVGKSSKDAFRGDVKAYDEVIKKGKDAATKDLAQKEELLNSGKPSKVTAIKDSISAVYEKTATKAKGLERKAIKVIDNFKSKESLGEKLKYVKDGLKNNKGAIKKAGIPVLIGAAALGAVGLAAKLISDKKAQKEE